MLERRKLRSVLMRELNLRAPNVQSHVKGSVTVAKQWSQKGSDEQMERRRTRLEQDVLRISRGVAEQSGDPVAVVRTGVKGSVAYVTVTTPTMIAQAGRGGQTGKTYAPETWPEQVAEVARAMEPVSAETLEGLDTEPEAVEPALAEALEGSER